MAKYVTSPLLTEVAYPETLMLVPREMFIGLFAVWGLVGGGGMLFAEVTGLPWGGYVMLISMIGGFSSWSLCVALYRRNPHFMTVFYARWIQSKRLWWRTTNLVEAPGNMYEV